MDRAGKRERGIIYILAILLCLVMASFWLMCNIYARYSSEASGSDAARVAKFDVTESGTATQQIQAEVYPGFSQTYRVDVTNNSEVAIVYVMNVENPYKNLPLQFRMLDENGAVITAESVETSQAYALSESAEIAANDHTEHTYRLEISWPVTETDKKNPDYAGKVDIIEITLKAVQKD